MLKNKNFTQFLILTFLLFPARKKMPSTLDTCEKLYGTRDIYELLGVDKKAQEKESE